MAGLSFDKPELFDSNCADEELIAARIAEICDELVASLEDSETFVFTAGEVWIDQEAVVRRA